jgi:hypothetical protein
MSICAGKDRKQRAKFWIMVRQTVKPLHWAVTYLALILVGCGGGSSSGSGSPTPPPPPPPPPPTDNIDDLTLSTSQFFSSATNGISIDADYGINTDTRTDVPQIDIRVQNLDGLRDSRIAFYQDTARVLADDYGDRFLEVTVSPAGESVDLGSATRTLSAGCDFELAQQLRISGYAPQGAFRWVHAETVTFTDNGAAPTCVDALNARTGELFNAAAPEYPFDLITLIKLQGVDSMLLGDLNGWRIAHTQSVAKYFRIIGDANFELADPNQRIEMKGFDSPADRADALLAQLAP